MTRVQTETMSISALVDIGPPDSDDGAVADGCIVVIQDRDYDSGGPREGRRVDGWNRERDSDRV